MGRRKKFWIKIGVGIIVVLLIAFAIVWETVPYVRYWLLPVTGGTAAPKTLTRSPQDLSRPRGGHVHPPGAYAAYHPQVLSSMPAERTEESS
jgi:hypothetical protein